MSGEFEISSVVTGTNVIDAFLAGTTDMPVLAAAPVVAESEKTAALPSGTVEMFLTVLMSKLTQWDECLARLGQSNPYATAHYAKAVQEIEARLARYKGQDDEQALTRLKDAISAKFVSHFPPAVNVIKQIDAFIASGKKPSLRGSTTATAASTEPVDKTAAAVVAHRSLHEVAREIRRDWKNPYFGAVPYLQAMSELDTIDDDYGSDSARSIVSYFLANASRWRGPVAAKLKAELNAMMGRRASMSLSASDLPFASTASVDDFMTTALNDVVASADYDRTAATNKTGAHYFDGRSWFADSDFLNSTNRVGWGTLRHMGFGEFYLDTPEGRVEFDRMRGENFPDQVGRSHQVYDDQGGKLVEKLVGLMERKNLSTRVASSFTAATHVEAAPAMPLEEITRILSQHGLTYLGERYGKAGEFWGKEGGSRVISVGRRDLLANRLQVEIGDDFEYRKPGRRWVSAQAEYLSRVTPGMVERMARWAAGGKTAKELLADVRAQFDANRGSSERNFAVVFGSDRYKAASLDAFFGLGFKMTADNHLVRKSERDLWRLKQGDDGGLVIERLFEGDTPLKG